MSYETLLTEVRGDGARRTLLITLNRPKALNALNDQLMDELGAALKGADADAGIGRRQGRHDFEVGRRHRTLEGQTLLGHLLSEVLLHRCVERIEFDGSTVAPNAMLAWLRQNLDVLID